MAIKVYKRNTAGRRNMSIVKPDQITTQVAEKSLLATLTKNAGRGGGKISVRRRGGGAKRRYRIVDFKQDKIGIPGTITTIERDPNRSALIALITYVDGEKRYILATEEMRAGQKILTAPDAPIENGNRMELQNIPLGSAVCNIEMTVGKGGQIVRSAGSGATLMAIEKGKAQIKMPSGEIRLVNAKCYATIGQVSNFEHSLEKIGKAGRNRHKRKRPSVRGSAMNPVDHPHGGGEGCQPIGLKHPKTPWGKCALGKKTRRKNRYSDRFIVKRRQETKRK